MEESIRAAWYILKIIAIVIMIIIEAWYLKHCLMHTSLKFSQKVVLDKLVISVANPIDSNK